ncbi:MAG: SPOR domain-containing protein, partial [Steroidobacteraceae bacterium]|nr:SPOR domain-containing protein [Steroidobacteraceae bacterium]
LYVQTGAFAESANARRQVERLRSAGIEGVFLLPAIGGDRTLHRVRIGPLGSVAEFDALSARLARLGITDARLASD